MEISCIFSLLSALNIFFVVQSPSHFQFFAIPWTTAHQVSHLLKLTQTHVHWVKDVIQPCCRLFSPSPPAFNLSQSQGLIQWVSSSHQVAKVLEFPLQYQSFQWIFRIDFVAGRGTPSRARTELGSCLTLRNELSEETHVLTKQEILLGKGTRVDGKGHLGGWQRAPGWRAVG